MTRFALTLLLALGGISALGQSCQPTDSGSSVKFIIKNFGLGVEGSLSG